MSRNRMFDRADSTQQPSSSASWLDEFAAQWEKQATTAVDEARKRQADSDYYSQISAIVSGNRKHATVASVVEEYQELTGLKKYLKTLAEKEESKKSKIKVAQQSPVTMDEDVTLENFKPELKEKINTLIDNKIKSNYGYSSVPAIQNELLRTLTHDGVDAADVYNPEMVKIITQKLKEYKDSHPKTQENVADLGKAVIEVDEAQQSQNDDFLSTLRTNKS